MTTLIYFIISISALVFIHELGHYLVALYFGVKIHKFSIGFGKHLIKWTDSRGTIWAISLLPFGGYVQMQESHEPQANPDQCFDTIRPIKRIGIAAAGPIANLMLAVCIWTGVNMYGVKTALPILPEPLNGSPAALSGLKGGEVISYLNSVKIRDAEHAMIELSNSAAVGETITIGFERNGEVVLTPKDTIGKSQNPLEIYGWSHVGPVHKPLIGKVQRDSPADKAGIVEGDVIVAIDGAPIPSWEAAVTKISKLAKLSTTKMEIERNGSRINIELTPIYEKGKMKIGISLDEKLRNEGYLTKQFGFMDSISLACMKAYSITMMSIKSIFGLIVGNISASSLSGPLGIADQAGKSGSAGLIPFFHFMAFLSISLFVMNLIPFPVLDGGHIIIALIEMTKGSPVSPKSLKIAMAVSMFFLMSLMAYSLLNDIARF